MLKNASAISNLPNLPSLPKLLTLPNGLRVVLLQMPHVLSASAGVFVHTGSRNESRQTNGISHFLEHMAFKGSTTRNAQAINMDAEKLGMAMNAFTSKEITAYFMSGLGKHTEAMVRMLADIVFHPIFPDDEIERERAVILQEATEYAEEPSDIGSVLLDLAIYGEQQAMGMPVIGTRKNIARFGRRDLVECVQRQYTGANVVVGISGCFDPDAMERLTGELFAEVPAGPVNRIEVPVHHGGVQVKKHKGTSQVFASLAFPVNPIGQGHHAAVMAATLFGGGMSSPLSNQIREHMGLAYNVGSSAEIGDNFGSFVIEAVTTPDKLPDFYRATADLLKRHIDFIDPVQFERARNQLSVDCVMAEERPFSLLQSAVEDLFSCGHVVGIQRELDAIEALCMEDVRAVFERMARARPALSLVGKSASNEVCGIFESAWA